MSKGKILSGTHTHTQYTERERELNVKIKAFERNYILIPS
jgi:hypothetical protein